MVNTGRPSVVTTLVLSVALSLMCPAARAKADEPQLPVTVLVVGDAEPAEAVLAALGSRSEIGLQLHFTSLPNAAREDSPNAAVDEALAAARRAYVQADFEACLRRAGDDHQVHALLGGGSRATAARLLFWRAACQVGAGDLAAARRTAARFVTFGLQMPPDVEAATPEVEATLGQALRRAEDADRVQLSVTTSAPRAAVSLDGRTELCAAPCTLDVMAGDHVVGASADGFIPEFRLVRVTATGLHAAFEMAAASPELAARQWTSRYATSPSFESTRSVELLALATRARRLVLLNADLVRRGTRLRGVLSVEGRVAARAERHDLSADELRTESTDLMRELLVRGELVEPAPGLLASPLFWIVIGVVAAGAAATTAYLLAEPNVRTEVSF